MKNKLNIMLSILIMILLIQFNAESTQRGRHIISQVESGTYIERDIIGPKTLRLLPIPTGNTDYAFYQSIYKVSNVVFGNFKVGNMEIVLIQDNNADGKVDIAAHWFVELKRLDRESEPDKFCSDENFKKLKELIINGKSEIISLGGKNYSISPNKGGIPEIENLVKIPSNVSKYKQGLRIKRIDPDERSLEMIVYSYSYNIEDNTADLAFNVKYYDTGKNRISPVINYSVYCSKSEDPFVLETAKKLREMTGKYLPK